jgi:hypothetical protein
MANAPTAFVATLFAAVRATCARSRSARRRMGRALPHQWVIQGTPPAATAARAMERTRHVPAHRARGTSTACRPTTATPLGRAFLASQSLDLARRPTANPLRAASARAASARMGFVATKPVMQRGASSVPRARQCSNRLVAAVMAIAVLPPNSPTHTRTTAQRTLDRRAGPTGRATAPARATRPRRAGRRAARAPAAEAARPVCSATGAARARWRRSRAASSCARTAAARRLVLPTWTASRRRTATKACALRAKATAARARRPTSA